MCVRIASFFLVVMLVASCEGAPAGKTEGLTEQPQTLAGEDGAVARVFIGGTSGDVTAESSKLDDPLFKRTLLRADEASLSGNGFLSLKRVSSLITSAVQDLAKLPGLAAASVAVMVAGDEHVTVTGPMQLSLATSSEPVSYLIDESLQPIALGVRSVDGVNATLDIVTTKNLKVEGDLVSLSIPGFGVYQIAWIKTPPAEDLHIELGPLGAGGLGDLSGVTGSQAAYTGPTILCREWDGGTEVGQLDASLLPEASGMAPSIKYPDRLYHVNDGPDAALYVTSLTGAGTKKVPVNGFAPVDVEFLSVGPCFSGKTCLFIGDFGNNDLTRTTGQLAVILEPESLDAPVTPASVVTYSLGENDLEAGAVHPVDGNLYMISKLNPKEFSRRFDASTLKVLDWNVGIAVANKKDWEGEPSEQRQFALKAVLEVLALPSIPALNPLAFKQSWLEFDPLAAEPSPLISKFVTDMSISADGKRLLLATYGNMIEFDYDLTGSPRYIGEMTRDKDYHVTSVAPLAQQEAVTYLGDGRSFLYSTEVVPGKTTTAPLVKVQCRKQ